MQIMIMGGIVYPYRKIHCPSIFKEDIDVFISFDIKTSGENYHILQLSADVL